MHSSHTFDVAAIFGTVVAAVVAFALLYNISFAAAPAATTGRFAVALLLVLFWKRLPFVARNFVLLEPYLVIVIIACVFWSTFLYFDSERADTTMVSRMLHFVLFAIVGALMFRELVGYRLDRLLLAFGLATFTQSCFIWVSFISPDFRVLTDTLLVTTGHIELINQFRVAGLSNSSGAALSVIQGLGAFCLALAATRVRHTYGALALLLGSAFVISSTLVVGRTGLVVALGLCSIVYFQILIRGRSSKRTALAIAIALSAAAPLFLYVHADPEAQDNALVALEWALRAVDPMQDASLRELASTQVPPLSLETMTGTGLVWNKLGYNESGHDSGYVQTYYAMGLLFAVAFYMSLAAMFLRSAIKLRSWWIAILSVIMLAIELKEPFIFKYAFPFLVLSLVLCWPRRTGADGCARALSTADHGKQPLDHTIRADRTAKL